MNILKFKYEIIFCFFVIIFILFSIFGITNPWGNDHNGFLAKEKAHYAINYLKHGYFETKLGQKISEGGSMDTYNERYSYYIHHPMIFSLLISFSFLIFGINEWALRIVPILINIGIITFLYLFIKNYWKKSIAVLALFFIVFSPMIFFNRNLAAFELLALFFVCVTLYVYTKWLTTGDKKYFYLIFISLILGSLSDWEYYFIIPVILIHYFAFVDHNPKNKKLLFLIPVSLLMFGLYIAYVFLLTGSMAGTGTGGDLLGNLLLRINMNENAWIVKITLSMILQHFVRDISNFYTHIFLFVPIAFFAILILNIIRKKNIEKEALPAILFLFYVLWLFIFSHMYIACEYIVLFLLPSLALFASLIIDYVCQVIKHRKNVKLLRPIFYIILIAFLAYYLYLSYPLAKNTYSINNMYLPLNDLLSKNKGNIIVSFGEDGSFYQLRPYLDTRIVRDVRSKVDFLELTNINTKFSYFFIKEGAPIDNELETFLRNTFEHQEIYNINEDRYIIFNLTK